MEGWKSGKNSVWELHIDATIVKNYFKVQLEDEKKLAMQHLQLERELEESKRIISNSKSAFTKMH